MVNHKALLKNDRASKSVRNKHNGFDMRLMAALVTIAVLLVLLLFPDHPESFTLQNFSKLPLEWPVIIIALLIVRGSLQTALRWVFVLVLALAVLLRSADIGSRIAFDRRFSPLVEWHLLGDGWNLASQQVGRLEAGLFIGALVLVLIVLAVALYKGLGAIGALSGKRRIALGSLAGAALAVGTVILLIQGDEKKHQIVQANFLSEFIDRGKGMQRSIIDQQEFVAELAIDPLDPLNPPTFAALNNRDVVFIFVESYGQSFLFDEILGKSALGRLADMELQIKNAGLHVKSGWMTSSVRGGRSWLAHASFASGLEITSQARFDRLVSSERVSLYSLFSKAGWKSVGILPAIKEAWPEGVWYGFDETHDYQRLNYKGEPFGWVTMPDQYTLSAFENNIRHSSDKPVMAEIALISSHAPWTPIPTLVSWDMVDDGSVFNGSHRFGEPMTWGNRSKVREMYAKSLDYSLATIGEYLARHGNDALFVIQGDHQPASIIAGWGKTADVPFHIVSDDPDILARFPDDIVTPGMVPNAESESIAMWSMRKLMATVFE